MIRTNLHITLFILGFLPFSEPARATEPDTAFNHQFRKEIGGWIAADATFSILLPDGRTLWLFGDTFLGEVNENDEIKAGARMIRNSAVLQTGDQLETLYSGTASEPGDFIPSPYPDSIWYWPEHGFVEDDTLWIFASKFREDPDGPPGFNFEQTGNDLAAFTYPGMEFIHTVPVLSHEINRVIYGDRVLADTGWTYLYGRRNDDPEINIAYPHVARAPAGQVMKQEWEYFDGSGWSADPLDTRRFNPDPVSQQYSVTTYRGKYILLTQDIWLSPKIFTYVSDSPEGPWENKKLIYTTPETSGDVFTYNAYAHPQFNRDEALLVSYNVNGDFWSIFSNVELYRPRFIRVPYMNLDYAFWPDHSGTYTTDPGSAPTLYPNPVMKRARLRFFLDEPGYVNFEVRDLDGRVVLEGSPCWLGEGEQELEIPSGSLLPGMYFCTLLIRDRPQVIPLIKSTR